MNMVPLSKRFISHNDVKENKNKKERGVHSFIPWMKRIFLLIDIESFPSLNKNRLISIRVLTMV